MDHGVRRLAVFVLLDVKVTSFSCPLSSSADAGQTSAGRVSCQRSRFGRSLASAACVKRDSPGSDPGAGRSIIIFRLAAECNPLETEERDQNARPEQSERGVSQIGPFWHDLGSSKWSMARRASRHNCNPLTMTRGNASSRDSVRARACNFPYDASAKRVTTANGNEREETETSGRLTCRACAPRSRRVELISEGRVFSAHSSAMECDPPVECLSLRFLAVYSLPFVRLGNKDGVRHHRERQADLGFERI